jgi:hypothetical protein
MGDAGFDTIEDAEARHVAQCDVPPRLAPVFIAEEWLAKKFSRLRDEWKEKRPPDSSSFRLAIHPAYLKIIGMGVDAVPLILRELERAPDMWFVALRSITEQDPVPNSARGNVAAMAKAWLDWGRDLGYEW